MEILSNTEDEEFRKKVKEEIGFHHPPGQGWEPLNMEDSFIVEWPGNDRYRKLEDKAIDLISEETEEVYILAFETDQYVPSTRELFKEKYDGNTIKVRPSEIKEVARDLIIIYILPENLNWIVMFDHEGGFQFTGEIKEKAEEIFDEG